MSSKNCIDFILKHEGGYVNNPKDPGGETNYGIAKKFYPDLNIRQLTKDQAAEIYYRDYWLKAKCDQMPLPVALMVLDSSVNQGISAASKILQRALNIKDDGVIGINTLTAIKNSKPSQLLPEMLAQRCKYYADTKNVDVFGLGWYRRCVDCYTLALSIK